MKYFVLFFSLILFLIPSQMRAEGVVASAGCYCELGGELIYNSTLDENSCGNLAAPAADGQNCQWYPDGLPLLSDEQIQALTPQEQSIYTVKQRLYGLNPFQSGLGSNYGSSTGTISVVAGRIIFLALSFAGSIALGLIIYAGLLYMVAQGNSEREKKAMGILVWTSLGLVAVLASYGIVRFIFEAIEGSPL